MIETERVIRDNGGRSSLCLLQVLTYVPPYLGLCLGYFFRLTCYDASSSQIPRFANKSRRTSLSPLYMHAQLRHGRPNTVFRFPAHSYLRQFSPARGRRRDALEIILAHALTSDKAYLLSMDGSNTFIHPLLNANL
jgi:hypothetical protein